MSEKTNDFEFERHKGFRIISVDSFYVQGQPTMDSSPLDELTIDNLHISLFSQFSEYTSEKSILERKQNILQLQSEIRLTPSVAYELIKLMMISLNLPKKHWNELIRDIYAEQKKLEGQ